MAGRGRSTGAAAGAAAAAAAAARDRAGHEFYGIGTPRPQQRDFKVDNSSWGDNRRLDLVAAPDAYLVCRDRALGHLCRDRSDVRKLLVWAESQSKEELEGNLAQVAAQAGMSDAEMVDYCLFEGIK